MVGGGGRHHVICIRCLYELITGWLLTVVRHRANHINKSTDIITTIVVTQ